jgi:uncharacterized protein (TIGR02466 family)
MTDNQSNTLVAIAPVHNQRAFLSGIERTRLMNALFASINPHSHISGVFYVKSDANSPAIGLKDPRMARRMMPPAADGQRAKNSFHAKLAPEPGKLILFASWLEHGVAQNISDRERISMSFNFKMRAKSQT